MAAFGFGAEEFDESMSEAVDRARGLLRDLYHLGEQTVSEPARCFGARMGGGPGPHGEHGGPEAHGEPGRAAHEPEDDPGERGPGGGWGGPWGGNWATGFSGKDWAGFFGGPRGGWWPGGPGPGRRGWGGPGRPGGPGGPGGPRRPKASRGDVRATILALLTEGPRTGYQIMSDIEERSRGAWRPSPGAVYPALQQLADEELIIGDEAGGRRSYRLTEAGQEYVTANPEMARGAWASMADAGASGPGELPRLFGEAARLGAAIAQLAHAGSPDQLRAAERLIKRSRRELYEILAGDDDSEAEAGGSGE
ncbi:MAG TPA: PadR family transcriptional regulator [Streptosporangiaceae bacterium]